MAMRMPRALLFALLALTVALTPTAGLAQTSPDIDVPTTTAATPFAERWVGAWASAQQRVYANIAPPAPGLSNATLRQVVRLTAGGSKVRVRIANDFGARELRVAAISIARPMGGDRGPRATIDPMTTRALTFAGADAAVVPAGASLWSDPVELDVLAGRDLAITMRLGEVDAANITTHPGARCTSFAAVGDAAAPDAIELPEPVASQHWYFLSGVDVLGDAGAAIVALGDSITDGRGTTTDGNTRWTDALAERLAGNEATRGVAVLNAGIGGNAVLRGGLGPTALQRFDRDVLAASGARWLLVLEGVNDIGGSKPDAPVAAELIAAYGQMIARAHARGMRAIGGTITPFAGSQYDSPEHEAARRAVNDWIRASGAFDAVVDFDAAVRDDAGRLRPEFDSGDHLHLNDAGYRAMAAAVDLKLFNAE